MITRTQKIRLAVFLLLFALLLVGSLATLAGFKLWNPKDRYFVRFQESISGLEVGSTVKMKGVRVGQVERIAIDEDVESVIVTLALHPNIPIPADAQAEMTSIGITGLQFIELSGGSSRAKRLQPNTSHSFIKVGRSALASLTGKAEYLAVKMEAVLNNLIPLTDLDNRVRIKRLLDDADRLVVNWADLAGGNSSRLNRILTHADRAAQAIAKSSETVGQLAGSARETVHAAEGAAKALHRMTQNLNPHATLSAISNAAQSIRKRAEDPSIGQAIISLNTAANKLSSLTIDLGKVVRQRDRQIGTVIENIDRTSSYLKEFSRSIKERPSLLLRGDTRKEREVP